MKKTVVKAYQGIGKNKVFVGQREIDEPQNFEDVRQLMSEEDAVANIVSSMKIDVQRQIRAGTTAGEKQKFSKLEAFIRANINSTDEALRTKAENLAKELEEIGIELE